MGKLGLFKNSDKLIEFCNDKIDIQMLKDTFKEVSCGLKFGDIIWPTQVPKNDECNDLVDKIEKRLVQNNNEYSRFSSDYFHCELSYEIFNENLKKGDSLDSDKNWKVIEIFKIENSASSSNYFSALFYNKYKGQAILSHRGIEANVSDFFKKESSLSDDLHGILVHEYIGQLVKCYEVTERCYKIAKELRCTLSFTGFSNGAWLAENCLYFCEKYIKADYIFDFEDFFEVQTKAVLFESPGIFRTKNEYTTNIISNEYEFDIKSLNIVNYLLSPNLMNSINYHVGIVYRLFLDEKDNIELKQREFLDKFSNIPLIGKKITEYSVEIRFLFNGLNSMFNKIVLKKILDNCFNSDTQMAINYCQMTNWPLIKIDFDKNLKENLKVLLDQTFESLLEMVPFLSYLNIASKPIQFVSRKITAKLIQSLMEGFTPAIHILICIMIEYFKGNMDLKFCNNPLFFSRLDDISNIVVNKEYIRKKYEKSGRENKSIETSSDNIVEKKIEQKFSLYYNSNYVPVKKSKIESKLLNISDDYTRNLDWILFHLKRGSHYKNIQSKIVRNHLEILRNMYEIEKLDLKEKVIYLIRIKNYNVNFEKIKEIILRILFISREDIREIIFRENSIVELNFTPNLGSRKPFVKRNDIIEQLSDLFYDKNLIYLYGKPGTGKSLLAKEFGFRFLNCGLVRFFECEDNFQFSNSYHKFLLNFLDEYTIDFGSIDYEKLNELACVKLLKQNSKILFIFDNVELIDIIESVVSNFLLNDKIKILITTRNKELTKNFDSIQVKFFNQKEAFDYVKLNNQDNLLNQKVIQLIISKLGIKNDKNQIEILPKTLEVYIKYMLENYIADDLECLLAKDDFQIFQYVFKTLDKDQIEMLKYFSFLNPKRINVLIIKDICKRDSKITDCIMKLNNIGIIDVHRKEKCLSMHRLIKIEIKKIFDTVIEKRKYLNELVNFILNNLHQNLTINNKDLNDEFLEHLNEIVTDNILDSYEILKIINNYLKKIMPSNTKLVELVLKISLQIHAILTNSKSKIDNSLISFSTSNLGICKFYLNKINESINLLNKSIINEKESFHNIRSLYYLGKCNQMLNKEEKALDFFQKAYDMHKQLLNKNETEENKAIFSDYLRNIAACFLKLNKLENSKKVYLEIEKKYTNDFNEIYKCFTNLAFIYLKLDDFNNALEYYIKSFNFLNEKCSKKDETELAKIASNIGFCYARKEDFKNALVFNQKAYDYQLNAVNYDIDPNTDVTNLHLASYLNNIGLCFLKLSDFSNAIHYCEQAYKMRKLVIEKDHPDLVISLKNLALCYFKQNDKTNAQKYYIQAKDMSRRLKSTLKYN